MLYADWCWLREIWVDSWLRNTYITFFGPLYVLCLLLMVPVQFLTIGDHTLLRKKMSRGILDLGGWFMIDILHVKQLFLFHPELNLFLKELRKIIFEILMLLACLYCTFLNIFGLYWFRLIQSVPLSFLLLLHFFPDQLLDSLLLSSKTKSGEQ